jgi:arsenate reductase
MTTITIWHNPRCSKSRAALAILEENGVTPLEVKYLETPPSKADIVETLAALSMEAKDIVRKGEAIYKSLNLSPQSTNEEILDALAENPILIERPIVISGDRAVIGRPPENVLSLL